MGSLYHSRDLGKSDMGRLTSGSKCTRIQDYMKKMIDQFRAALKDDALQEAFDELWPTWSSEMAAMIYSDILQVTDLFLLTSVIDNRREIELVKKTRTRLKIIYPWMSRVCRIHTQTFINSD